MTLDEWIAFCGLQLLAASGGVSYTLGALAVDLKELNDFTQAQINVVAAMSYFLVAAQLLVGFVSMRWPRAVVITAQTLATIGWVAAALLSVFAPLPFGYMAAAMAVMGLGVSSSGASAVALFDQSLHASPVARKRSLQIFLALFAFSGGIGAALYTLISGSKRTKLTVFFATAAGLSAVALAVVVKWLFAVPPSVAVATAQPLDNAADSVIAEQPLISTASASPPSSTSTPSPSRASSLLTAAAEMLPVLLTLFLQFGCAVNFYNTSGSMAVSQGASAREITWLFLVFCGGQFLGRVLSTLWTNPETPPLRAHLLLVVIPCVLGTLSLTAWFKDSPAMMYLYSAFNSLCYGSLWVCCFDLPNRGKAISERTTRALGGTSFVVVYGFLCLAPGFGPLTFDLLSGVLYDRHADPTTHMCVGEECWRTYYLVAAVLQAVALLLAFTVLLRTLLCNRRS